jgi:hypothetical protein
MINAQERRGLIDMGIEQDAQDAAYRWVRGTSDYNFSGIIASKIGERAYIEEGAKWGANVYPGCTRKSVRECVAKEVEDRINKVGNYKE